MVNFIKINQKSKRYFERRDFLMKTRSIGKIIYFLIIFLVFPLSICKATSTLEDSLQTEGLSKKVAKKYCLKPGSTFDKKTFDKIFPLSEPEDFSHGWYCGQLRSLSGGRGTGTLIALEERNGCYIGTGLTALHVFLEFYTDPKNVKKCQYRPKEWKFYQNSTSTDNKNSTHFAEIKVTQVLFDPSLGEDICLFKGIYKLNGEYLPEILLDIIPIVQGNFPKVSEKIITSEKAIRVSFYHHPLGELQQRKNKGKALPSNSTHTVSTLPGSSGASLYSKKTKEIVGIHIGSIGGSPIGLVSEDVPKGEIEIVENNSFILVSAQKIKIMYESLDDLHKLSTDLLYSKLVPAIYPETFFQSKDDNSE